MSDLLNIQRALVELLTRIQYDTFYGKDERVQALVLDIDTKIKQYDFELGLHWEDVIFGIQEYEGRMAIVKKDLQEILYLVDDLLTHGYK